MTNYNKRREEVISRCSPIEGRADWIVLGYLLVLLATQRFALPIGGKIPVAAFIGPIFIAHLYFVEAIKINIFRVYALLIFGAVLIYSTVSNEKSSIGAAFSYIFLYFLWIFDIRHNCISPRFIKNFTKILTLIGIAAIFQYIIQYIYPTSALFSYQGFVNSDFLIEYNSLNAVSYGSEYYKANGFIFPEASALSQYLGRSVVLLLFSGWGSASILFAVVGMLVAYSGTGLIVLLLYCLLFFKRLIMSIRRKSRIVIIGAVAIVLSIQFSSSIIGNYFDVNLLLQRMSEFSSTNSSAYSRFISPIDDIAYVVNGRDFSKTLFGNGPGTVDEFRVSLGRSEFASGWLKAFYEFGVVGSMVMAIFVFSTFFRSSRSFAMSLIFLVHYYILDGNINVPQYSIVSLILGGIIPWWSLSITRRSNLGHRHIATYEGPPVLNQAKVESSGLVEGDTRLC